MTKHLDLESQLSGDGIVVAPGIFDAMGAVLVEQAGFHSAYLSGASIAYTRFGQPDIGLVSMSEVADALSAITERSSLRIIVDADTGYGNALNTYRTVSELIDTGAAGCFLEDQVWPKRCGHMRDKRVVERGEYLERIRAAVEARGEHDFFIVARTDALAAVGLDEALARVDAAHVEGADATFVEAPSSLDQLADVGRLAPKPTVANMVDHGRTPMLDQARLAEMGFDLILYPLTGLYAATHALTAVYQHLHKRGTTAEARDSLVTFQQFNDLIGVGEKNALSDKFREGV